MKVGFNFFNLVVSDSQTSQFQLDQVFIFIYLSVCSDVDALHTTRCYYAVDSPTYAARSASPRPLAVLDILHPIHP